MLATKKFVKNEISDLTDMYLKVHQDMRDSIYSLRYSLDQLVFTLGYDYDYPQTRPRIVKKLKKAKK